MFSITAPHLPLRQDRGLTLAIAMMVLWATAAASAADTIRIGIGTQDTTINTVTGGLLIRELKLLEKHLPHDGKYQDVTYDIEWKNFTSGPPLTNEMVAGKLDIGSMADFPGALNGVAFQKAGKRSLFINVLSGSTIGSGNGIVVPIDSPVQRLEDLKGKQISVPFGSTAHGLLLRAIHDLGWDPERDVNLVSQSPEVGGTSLQAHKIDAHADFVPFAELFPFRGFARKIYDGAQAKSPTFHGTLVTAEFAERYPEIVVAFLAAAIEADRLFAAEPEKYSELVQKVTGIEAEVTYLFHGPLGIQTRDLTWKPEYRAAVTTAIATLKLLKKTDADLDVEHFIDDRFIIKAFAASGLDYAKKLSDYAKQPLTANAAGAGEAIVEPNLAAQLWLAGEPLVRTYASPEHAFSALAGFAAAGKPLRVAYVHDRISGLKLFAIHAWYVRDAQGALSAFLLQGAAEAWAKDHGGTVLAFPAAKAGTAPADAPSAGK
jgi:NitT/TauT family transport system substrate-binding protein